MKKLWIARDKDGSLFLYRYKPEKCNESFFDVKNLRGYMDKLEDTLFPSVTFDNSPQQVELKLNGKKDKWEYTECLLWCWGNERLIDCLNRYGKDGWQLVNEEFRNETYYLIFKRKIQ